MSKNIKIAILEDDLYYNKLMTKYINTLCSEIINSHSSYEINSFRSALDCLENIDEELDIMLLDYNLSDENDIIKLNGEDVLDIIKKHCPNCKVILVTANQNASTTISLIKQGIHEYIDKNDNSREKIGSTVRSLIHELRRA